MKLIWDQSAGSLSRDGVVIGAGYAGAGRGKNNPSMQAAKAVGPIPRGRWRMVTVRDSPNTGPYTIVLEPCSGTDTCGRGDFRIHGDSIRNPGTASHGCIVIQRAIRQAIYAPGREIEVVE
jgi:hypothetical protein